MKKLIIIAALLVSGCVKDTWYGNGTPIGQHQGKTLLRSTCEVVPSAVGQPNFFNKKQLQSPYYACEGQMKNTCGGDFTVVDFEKGSKRRATETHTSRGYRTTRTFTLQKVTVRYTCAA